MHNNDILLIFGAFLLFYLVPIAITYMITRAIMNRRRVSWLQAQVQLWEENKIISPEQAGSILDSSKISRDVPKKKFDMIKLVTLFGAVFIGIGVIFLIASNWQEIPKFVRTGALLLLTIGTMWAGYFLSYEKGKYPVLGKSLIVLASILWGATLALIAQIYNLSSDGSWVILILWAVPLLPLAYFLENEYIYILATVILGIWNISFSVGKGLPNYYYPAIVFLCLFPLAKKFEKGLVLNIVGLIIGAFFAMALKYTYIPLFVFSGLMVYYIVNIIKPPVTEELFLFCSGIALLAWNIGYNIASDFKNPNYYMLIPLTLVFFLAYKKNAKASLGINILNVLVWFNFIIAAITNVFKYQVGVLTNGSFEIFLGVVIYLTGMLHEYKKEDKDYGYLYKVFGFMLSFGVIYFLSFTEIHDKDILKDNLITYISFGLLAIGVFMIVFLVTGNALKKKQAKLELAAVLTVILGTLFMLLNPSHPKLNVYVINAMLVIISGIMLFLGMEIQSPKIFNSGIAALILFIVTRYLDVFWKLKEKSLFFIVSGILFIAGGSYLEKKRREIVRRMKDEK